MKKNLFRLLIMVAMVVGMTAQANNALAAVAANAPIINQATMLYDDGTGLKSVTAEVTVTVTLVPAAPVLDCPVDQTSSYTNTDTQHTYSYTLTSASNGPDDYTVAASITGSGNTTLTSPGSDPVVNLAPNPVRLGASITTSGSTTTVIAVPSDSDDPSNGSINDIAVNDYVVINGEVRQVTAISEDPTATNYITLDAALSAAPLAGTGVYEQVSLTVDIFSGTLTAAGTDVTVDFEVTAENANLDSTLCANTSTFTSGIAVLTKYVRNLSDVAANTGGTGGQNFNIDGAGVLTYFTDGVTASPGDTLEYVLVAQNTGAAPLTSSQVNDVLPTNYVAFLGGQYTGATDIVYQDDASVEFFYTQAVGDDQGQFVGAALTVWVGDTAAFNSGGDIPATSNVKVAYQVQVNP